MIPYLVHILRILPPKIQTFILLEIEIQSRLRTTLVVHSSLDYQNRLTYRPCQAQALCCGRQVSGSVQVMFAYSTRAFFLLIPLLTMLKKPSFRFRFAGSSHSLYTVYYLLLLQIDCYDQPINHAPYRPSFHSFCHFPYSTPVHILIYCIVSQWYFW